MRKVVWAAALLVVATACGPELPLEIGVKDRPTDVVYGSQKKPPQPAPVPLAPLDPGFPSFIVPPPTPMAVARPVPALPKVACPQAGPFDFPGEPVTAGLGVLPKEGRYRFRQEGSGTIDGQPVAPIPAETERVITNVVRDEDGSFTYDLSQDLAGVVTTTTYRYVHFTDNSEFDGIYIVRQVMTRPDGSQAEFRPSGTLAGPVGARVLRVPTETGATWAATGTDALRATSMIVQGTVVDRDRIDACGTLVDAWKVTTTGTVVGPTKNLTITATYQVANQLGGLIVADDVTIKGTDNGVAVDQHVRTVINSPDPLPLEPRS